MIPPVIQRDPLGLLGFFNLKTGGIRPRQLAEFVQPTMELVEWYAAGNSRWVSGTPGTYSLGFNAAAGLSPPTGKAWLILRGLYLANVNTTNFVPCQIAQTVGGAARLLGEPARLVTGGVVGSAAADLYASYEAGRDGYRWVRDEDQLGVWLFQPFTGTPGAGTLSVEYVELDV